MKNKFQILTLVLGFLFLIPLANADMPITGTAYGENIGLIHFDYVTAINPFDECVDIEDATPDTVNCPFHAEYSSYHTGPREDFYISPLSPYLGLSSPDYDSGYIARIGDSSTCDDNYCYLEGYLWSDEIGWIALEGESIQSTLNATDFPESSFARISTGNGVLSGFIWSEKTGWIKLASDGFIFDNPQSQSNWGVWMNPFDDPEAPLVSSECAAMSESECNSASHICNWSGTVCNPYTIEVGRKLRGNAWSQKLGWIKFNSEGEFFNGVYTTWIPDVTPPVLNVDEENVWFANDSAIGLLAWEDFASDPESGIDIDETEFYITTDSPGCATAINDTDGPTDNDTDLFIESTTQRLKVSLATYGLIGETTDGYCKYTLEAKITNGAGLTYYIDDPSDNTIEVPAGYDIGDSDKYRGTPLTFFVRAGDYDNTGSSISASTATCTDPSNTAIADGVDCYEYHFNPVDIAGNPIVPVEVKSDGTISANPNDWMRNAEGKFIFDSDIFFDQILPPPSGNHAVPISFDGGNPISQIDLADVEYESLMQSATKSYPVQVNAFAPTYGDNTFAISSAVLTIRDSEMPKVSEFVSKTDAVDSYDVSYDENVSLAFNPAISVSAGSLDSDVIIPAVDIIASYTLNNYSADANIDKYAIDSSMYFENTGGTGYGSEVLDMRNILALDNLTDDSYIGRTDPIAGATRYLVMTSNNNYQNNIYHTSSQNWHDESYSFLHHVIPSSVSSTIETNGQYEVDGIFDLTQEEKDKLNDPDLDPAFTYPDISIDRNDVFADNELVRGTSKEFSFGVTPNQYLQQPPTAVVAFGVNQYVAYNVTLIAFDRYTIFEIPSLINGVEFSSLGLQATGKVIGENIYDTTGRDLDSLSPTDAGELKKMIRKNVADITRNMDLENCNGSDVASLPTDAGDCIIVDKVNKTIIAVYTSDVILTGNITVPDDYSYTLLLRDGANLTIEGNILPGDSIAFGIIALADDEGSGGNVYIDPEPTDIHALLYAEGSLISREGAVDCYESGTCDLKNQLYWKGSIVSRNTIGGAPSATLPPGISKAEHCPTLDAFKCAQKYDMDYLRRFTLKGYEDDGHYADNGVKYSGDNFCDMSKTPPECSFNGETTMAVTADDGNQLIDIELSKSYDPVFVEKDNRPAPPGFSTSAGFTRSQTIR